MGFIEAQGNEGRYTSASDVVHAGLRLLKEQASLAALRAALIKGEESGLSTCGVDDIWAVVKERHSAARV